MKEVWAEGGLGKKTGGKPRVIFGQVHEDAACELAAVREVALPLRRCVVIGSGGCTAFCLLASGAERVDAVDINPAQIHLIEAKRAALRTFSFGQIRQAFEVDARSLIPGLASELSEDARRFWSENQGILRHGFQQCGVVERNLRKAMGLFYWTVRSRREVGGFLHMDDVAAQKSRFQGKWDDWRWRMMFAMMFHPWLLAVVYGRSVLKRLPANAAQSVRENLKTALTRLPARENGYLWQTFLQRYPEELESARPLYLRETGWETIRGRLDSLHVHCADVVEWLAGQSPGSIGFFALSNILELAPPQFAESLAAQVIRVASPEAVVITRRIFAVESEGHHPGLVFDADLSARLNGLDRSPVCRHLRLYRVRK